jgi:hypothetical protein
VNAAGVPFAAHDLYFREWHHTDVDNLVRLFDTAASNGRHPCRHRSMRR